MRSIRLVAVAAMLATALAACSSNNPTVSKSPVPVPVLPGGQNASTSATPTATSTASTTVDPCQLVTAPEASALTGASYSSGKLEIDSPVSRRCIYGGQTKHVFEVIFVQGSTPAEAKAYADTLRAQAEQQLGGQVALTQLTGVGDDAESLHGSLSGIDVAGVYVRQGVYGVALVDETLGHAASIADLITQAQTALGRLP